MNILDKIVCKKELEVKKKKEILPLHIIEKGGFPEVRDFKSSIKNPGISVIAEIKRRSPSAGIIRENFDPIKIAGIYENNGADAVSILTDEKFFGGKYVFLTDVKRSISLPVLQKEFIIDPYQIYESRLLGADSLLLIAKILSPVQLKDFIQIARSIGLTALVEVHTSYELEKVLNTGAEIIGINNRNLDTFETDLKTSLKLIKMIPQGYTVVSESGIRIREDVQLLEEAGFDAVLIGESLMRAEKIGEKLRTLKGKNLYEKNN
jgi:indole-3-glycerol phosphate synthase